ncbi:MAG: MFS transporter [Clostridiaceae bacterium]|jgi:MFS family permease|nr:MFS transporter [Clostridiaceae bacterium]
MSASCLLLVDRMSIAILFAVLQGITQGIQVVWVGLVWPDYFGMRHLGSIRGFAMSATVISSALGPLLFGAVFDLTSSYRLILILSVVITLFGLALSVFSRPPTPKVFKNDYLP